MPLGVLALTVILQEEGVHVRVRDKKAEEWARKLGGALNACVFTAGEASEMAGRLGFTSPHTFLKLGRAMLRPVFAQQYAPLPKGRVGPPLKLAMQWWLEVSKCQRSQLVPWRPCTATVELFCDAMGGYQLASLPCSS